MDIEGPFAAADLTGERTLPGIAVENYWFQRHVVAYRYAAGHVKGLEILDAGSGEGYGADILAASAADVVGVDLDERMVHHSGRRYPRARFEQADLLALPFPDSSFDAVVSLQVIEHLTVPREFISECTRVLRPGGRLIVSTPNRLTFSKRGTRNPFHTYEFAPDDLRTVLESRTTVEALAGTFHTTKLRLVEAMIRVPFQQRIIDQPAPEWPAWLRLLVERSRPSDFAIRSRHIDRSLDLIAIARR